MAIIRCLVFNTTVMSLTVLDTLILHSLFWDFGKGHVGAGGNLDALLQVEELKIIMDELRRRDDQQKEIISVG